MSDTHQDNTTPNPHPASRTPDSNHSAFRTPRSAFGSLNWNNQGLIPAILQDAKDGTVLMMAWMNEEALQLTQERGEAVFWSRSRQEIWHKGATSGNVMRVHSIHYDCDGDTLLLQVDPAGPACHTGARSCFFQEL